MPFEMHKAIHGPVDETLEIFLPFYSGAGGDWQQTMLF